jgi:hypothetical protein
MACEQIPMQLEVLTMSYHGTLSHSQPHYAYTDLRTGSRNTAPYTSTMSWATQKPLSASKSLQKTAICHT